MKYDQSAMLALTLCLLLTACSPLMSRGMNAQTLRAAIDECQTQNLNVLMYKRPDGSVFAIRCLPREEEISKSVIVRPKMPVNILRPFLKKETLVIEE